MKANKLICLVGGLERKLMPIEHRLYKIPLLRSAFQAVYNTFIPDKKILIEIFGQKMYVSLRARHYIQGVFERGTTEVFKRVVKRGMTVFDIGANIGYYTLLARSLVGSEGRVFAFEPHPEAYEKLKENIKLNGYTNVIPLNKAVSNKSGRTKFYLHSDSGRSSLLHPEDENKWIEVETIVLDEFIEREGVTPDIIKMDIEGAEPLALEGMRKLLKTKELILFIEYEYNKKYISKFLEKMMFELYFITQSGELIPLERGTKYQFLESNIFAIKRYMSNMVEL